MTALCGTALPLSVMALDEEGFRRYLKKSGKSEKSCDFEVRNMKNFEEYLSEHKDKKLEEASPEDLKDFTVWAKETGVKIWLRVLNRYYRYKQNDVMFCAVNELIGAGA